jgi:hypothetical protein
MGNADDGGIGSLFGKAKKWLSAQGVTDEDLAHAKEDLAKAKADSDRREAEEIANRDAQARESRVARTGGSHVTLRGAVSGHVDEGLSVQTERDGGSLFVTVECVDPVPLSGGNLAGLTFAIPQYKGSGTYDLSTMDVSGLIYELMLDPAEEGFYWAPEYGPGVVTVSDGESTADIRFVYQDPGSNRTELEGVIELT